MLRLDYHPGFDMADTQALRDEIARREFVADFAQALRATNLDDGGYAISVEGYHLHVYAIASDYSATLDPFKRELYNWEKIADVTNEEMLVIEQCLSDENAYVEQIIDRTWDAN